MSGERMFSEKEMNNAVFVAAANARQEVYAEMRKDKKKSLHNEIIDFCERGRDAGVISDEMIDNGIVEFMHCIADQPGYFEFAEGGPTETRLQWFQNFLKSVKKLT